MDIKTHLEIEMSNEEYNGTVQRVVRAIGQAAKGIGHYDLSQYSEDDIRLVGQAAVEAVVTTIFKNNVEIKPPF